jgi:hypothetical protein
MIDFAGDEYGNNLKMEFKKQLIQEANTWIAKRGTMFDG